MRNLLILTILFLVVTGCVKEVNELSKDKEIILMRKISHEVMRYAEDSTTAISPIQEISDGKYLLEFKSEFAFESDSLIDIIDSEMEILAHQEYVVKVNSCSTSDLIFSYYISESENNDLVSCMGRSQDKDCYQIEITLLDERKLISIGAILTLFILPFIGFFLYKHFRKPKDDLPTKSQHYPEGVYVGQYVFDYGGQTLILNNSKITLTYKESKILKVLTENMNDVVERDELQKQVWEEDGIVVGRSLDMFISKLRKKFKEDQNVEIKNIHGIGYKLIAAS